MLVVLALLAVAQTQPTCEDRFGNHVCGYHCRWDSSGNVACAATEEGVCTAVTGRVHCWDPSPTLIAIWPGPLPPARCLETGFAVACGYRCTSAFGSVACARTPLGLCRAYFGKVTCWDPPLALIYATRALLPPPECREEAGQVACGYHCGVDIHGVRCAQTPQGGCHDDLAGISCWDPELPPLLGSP